MIVVVVTACPPKFRGQLTRWLLEISAGVYVGHCSARVRDKLWERILEHVGRGKALMVHSVRGEQWLAFRVHQHEWQPTDFDGLSLMMRPRTAGGFKRTGADATDADGPPRERKPSRPENWSIAARRRRFRTIVERRRDEE